MDRKTQKAYMTVEASLVMPMILGGIIFTIYLGIYLYNVCFIKQAAYIAALRGSCLLNSSSQEIENHTRQQLEKLFSGQILAGGKVRSNVRVSMGKVKVQVSMDMKMPFAGFISPAAKLWQVKSEAETNRGNPVDVIRNVRKINGSQISE